MSSGSCFIVRSITYEQLVMTLSLHVQILYLSGLGPGDGGLADFLTRLFHQGHYLPPVHIPQF